MRKRDDSKVFGRIMALEMMSTNFLTMTLGGGTAEPLAALEEFRATILDQTPRKSAGIDDFQERCWEEAMAALNQLFDSTRERLLSHGFEH
jgi:hypothetical protein